MTWEHCAREGKPRGAPPPTSNIAYCCFRTQLLAQVPNMMKDAKLKGRVRADGYMSVAVTVDVHGMAGMN
jgi:hypothetical protein